MRLKSHLKTQKPASVMVWAAVSPCGLKSPLVFIPKGVKVNTAVYLDMMKKKVLPWLNNTHWDHGWIFQQDGAPSHTSNKTQMWCNENLEGFWPKNMRPLPLKIFDATRSFQCNTVTRYDPNVLKQHHVACGVSAELGVNPEVWS